MIPDGTELRFYYADPDAWPEPRVQVARMVYHHNTPCSRVEGFGDTSAKADQYPPYERQWAHYGLSRHPDGSTYWSLNGRSNEVGAGDTVESTVARITERDRSSRSWRVTYNEARDDLEQALRAMREPLQQRLDRINAALGKIMEEHR